MFSYSEEDFLALAASLRPQGRAWPDDPGSVQYLVLRLLARALNRAQDRWRHLVVVESLPPHTVEMLPDWEYALGLPDDCAIGTLSMIERQAAVKAKLTQPGGQSMSFFQTLAETLGYQGVVITEFQPFVAGASACGDAMNGPPEVRHEWEISVPGERLVDFHAGAAQCGDSLGTWRAAEDLECRLNYAKPAQSTLIFIYEGAANGL